MQRDESSRMKPCVTAVGEPCQERHHLKKQLLRQGNLRIRRLPSERIEQDNGELLNVELKNRAKKILKTEK